MKFLSWLSRQRSPCCSSTASDRSCHCCWPGPNRKRCTPQPPSDAGSSKKSKRTMSSLLRAPLRLLERIHKPSWFVVFQLLFSEATLPGLRNVFGFSPSLPRMVFAGVFLYLVHRTVKDVTELVTNYLEFHTTLQVTIEEPKADAPMIMPAVTICNQNPLLLSKLCSPANRNLIEIETNKTCPQPSCENFITAYYETLCLGGDQGPESLRYIFGSARHNKAARIARRMFFEWYDALMDFEKGRELLRKLSYKEIRDTISRCSFDAHDCLSSITSDLLPTYGVCFCVYCNSTQNVDRFEGPVNGLMLDLRVNEEDYMPMIPTAGHLVMIHEKDDKISVSEDAVYVHPLATSYIGLRKSLNINLPPPSKDPCTGYYPPELAVHLSPSRQQKYSLKQCLGMCTQMAILRECKCVDFKYPLPEHVGTTECSYVLGQVKENHDRYNSSIKCAIEAATRIGKDALRCGCLRKCEESLYYKVNTALFWHPDLQRQSLGTKYSSNSTVYVYMQSNKINFRKKVMQTSIKDLLNAIAGTMGLYLGYSYLFIFYIIDILIRGVLEIARWHNFKTKQPPHFKDARLQAY